jgi:hypothetical protein
MLELGAVNLNDCCACSKQHFGGGLDDPGLPGSGRSQEKQNADRPITGR